MEPKLQEELASVLTRIKGQNRFYAQGQLPANGLKIQGGEREPLLLPVRSSQFSALKRLASRAPYGRGSQTIVDTDVRRVWQITPEQLHISGLEPTIKTIIAELRREMAVSDPVEAQFYKVLLYEKGDFFVEHRDSEKHDRMFGTLIISLPSSFTGGRLKLRHAEETLSFELSSRSQLCWVAFYADCLHEIEPIESGHRVALVFNLLRSGKGQSHDALTANAAQPALQKIFADWRRRKSSARLAILLDHHYSSASLSLDTLKGEDQGIVRELMDVSQKLNLGAALGILSRSEQGYGYGDEYGDKSHRWYDEDDDEEDDEDDDGDFTIEEVTDFQTTVNNLIPLTQSRTSATEIELEADQFFPAEIFESLEPDKMSFEEATGNEGGTFERSYRRACVLLWPLEKSSEMVLAASPPALLQHLLQMPTNSDDDPSALFESREKLLARLLEQIEQRAADFDKRDKLTQSMSWLDLTRVLEVSSDPMLSLKCARACQQVLYTWPESALVNLARLTSSAPVDELSGFIEGLSKRSLFSVSLRPFFSTLLSDSPASVRDELLLSFEKHLKEEFNPNKGWSSSWKRKEIQEEIQLFPIQVMLRVCKPKRLLSFLEILTGSGRSLVELAELLLSSLRSGALEAQDGFVLDWILERISLDIAQSLDEPKDYARSSGTMKENDGRLCKTFIDFMRSGSESTLRLAAAESDRKSLLYSIDSGGVIDVQFEIDRSTRPFALVFTKTKETYKRALARRGALQRLHAELSALVNLAPSSPLLESVIAKQPARAISKKRKKALRSSLGILKAGDVIQLADLKDIGMTSEGIQRWLANGIISEVAGGYELSETAAQTILALGR